MAGVDEGIVQRCTSYHQESQAAHSHWDRSHRLFRILPRTKKPPSISRTTRHMIIIQFNRGSNQWGGECGLRRRRWKWRRGGRGEAWASTETPGSRGRAFQSRRYPRPPLSSSRTTTTTTSTALPRRPTPISTWPIRIGAPRMLCGAWSCANQQV